jgi:hypothetical protein
MHFESELFALSLGRLLAFYAAISSGTSTGTALGFPEPAHLGGVERSLGFGGGI